MEITVVPVMVTREQLGLKPFKSTGGLVLDPVLQFQIGEEMVQAILFPDDEVARRVVYGPDEFETQEGGNTIDIVGRPDGVFGVTEGTASAATDHVRYFRINLVD